MNKKLYNQQSLFMHQKEGKKKYEANQHKKPPLCGSIQIKPYMEMEGLSLRIAQLYHCIDIVAIFNQSIFVKCFNFKTFF